MSLDETRGEISISQALQAIQTQEQRLKGELSSLKKILGEREAEVQSLQSLNQRIKRDSAERRVAKEQYDQLDQRFHQLSKQYEELYQYCQSLLSDAEKERETLRGEVSRNNEKIELARKRIQEYQATLVQAKKTCEEITAEKLVLATKLRQKDEEHQASVAEANSKMREIFDQLEAARVQLARLGAENELLKDRQGQIRARATHYEHMITSAFDHVTRTRGFMHSTVQTLEAVQGSIRNLLADPALGAKPLTLKAVTVVAEQLAMELQNLKRVESLLLETGQGLQNTDPGSRANLSVVKSEPKPVAANGGGAARI